MANEIFARVQLLWDFKETSRLIEVDESWRDDSLARYNSLTQDVGTSWEALEVGDLVKQWMTLTNLDTVNFISWGKSVADATELIRIPPGKTILIYNIAAAPAVKADTGDCDLLIRAVEGSS